MSNIVESGGSEDGSKRNEIFDTDETELAKLLTVHEANKRDFYLRLKVASSSYSSCEKILGEMMEEESEAFIDSYVGIVQYLTGLKDTSSERVVAECAGLAFHDNQERTQFINSLFKSKNFTPKKLETYNKDVAISQKVSEAVKDDEVFVEAVTNMYEEAFDSDMKKFEDEVAKNMSLLDRAKELAPSVGKHTLDVLKTASGVGLGIAAAMIYINRKK